ncbi:MAG TPA: response regulator [Pyrinomonadaceae bacterium]|jgi:CheY-like chemotaxis protein|nr:response regulator [Pyrinomonadaceae bacterium]
MTLLRDVVHNTFDPTLSTDDTALLRCRLARELIEKGNYDAASEAFGDLWQGIGERPLLAALSRESIPEVLITAGTLNGWLGSIRQIQGSQEFAKNLLSEGITIFETLEKDDRAAEARSELAYCYWREGAFDEARVLLKDAVNVLRALEDDRRNVALLRSVIVEESARRYHDALRIHLDAAPLFEVTQNYTLKGKFHHLFGFVLKKIAETEQRPELIDQALIEYAAASFYFEQAGQERHQACVENNIGFLFAVIKRFEEAHDHLDRAQMLFTRLKDDVHLAQVDETRARVMVAEGRIVEAEKTVRAAVRTLEQGDERSLLADALTTHGIAQARLHHPEQARATLERALEVAEQAGDLESAGNAALVLVEELSTHLTTNDLKKTVDRAGQLLANTQDLSVLKRLAKCTGQVLAHVHASPRFPGKVDWPNFSFKKILLEYEAHFIDLALEESGGVVSRAARLLGFNHHQSLLSLLNGRHETLRQRDTPIVPRRRSIIKQRAENGKSNGKRRNRRKPRILHVEDNPDIAGVVHDHLEEMGLDVDSCSDGTEAMQKIAAGFHYDLLIFDNEVPGFSGKQLVRVARSLAHYRETPIVILSGDQEDMVDTTGVNAFLRKPDDMKAVGETVTRLLNERS